MILITRFVFSNTLKVKNGLNTPQIFHCYWVICRTNSENNEKSSAKLQFIVLLSTIICFSGFEMGDGTVNIGSVVNTGSEFTATYCKYHLPASVA